jgi:hypothetical protein
MQEVTLIMQPQIIVRYNILELSMSRKDSSKQLHGFGAAMNDEDEILTYARLCSSQSELIQKMSISSQFTIACNKL